MSYLFRSDSEAVARAGPGASKDPSHMIGNRLYSSLSGVSFSATARSAASSLSNSASYVAAKTATTASTAASAASSTASSAASAVSSASSSAASVMSSVTNTAASGAAVVASSAAAVVTKKSSASMNGRKEEIVENDMYVEYLKELRMNYEYAAEKVAIFDSFYNLLEPGSLFLTADAFVIDCKKRGYTIQWADAAFRAADVENRGALNKFEYLFAVVSLQADERFVKNPRWLELRRKVVYAYYARSNQKAIGESDFLELLRDLSMSNEEPEAFGICNKKWSGSLSQSSQHGGHDVTSLAQQLAMSNLELVQKKSEYEELHLQYIQLEKKYVGLKLELQALRDKLDI